MAKEVDIKIKLQVKGGQANPAPPVGPALGAKGVNLNEKTGSAGVNIMEFCKRFNAETQDKMGKVCPVIINVYKDKSFDFIIKTSPASVQLLELSGAKKGSDESNRKKVGKVTWDQVQKVAEDKMSDLNALTLHSAMKMVAGSARSLGITVEGTAPWDN